MRNIRIALWALLLLPALGWLAVEPDVFARSGVFALRPDMLQLSGIAAMVCMTAAMLLALRPRWLESWLGGLDKMYRLHKWLGIGALVLSVLHWLWVEGPKWAVGWGLLTRPQRGPRVLPENLLERAFLAMRDVAEHTGEWGFYAAILLIALALLKFFPYRLFARLHQLLAISYLAFAFHAVVLFKFSYWSTPLGLAMAPLLASGVWAAIVVLRRQIGAGRKLAGTIGALRHFPGMRTLEVEVDLAQAWPGHKPGQFAFVTFDAAEGPHPYTISSAWNPDQPRIGFMIKALGDHTRRLRETLRTGQPVTVEGPYGRFTFEDDLPRQIWVGGGIGITPFIARLEDLAARGGVGAQAVDLFHSTREVDEDALDKLRAAAKRAGVRLHLLVEGRDGLLSGERIRALVPDWARASLWFCGPAGFGQALRADFAGQGLNVQRRFHQELFALR